MCFFTEEFSLLGCSLMRSLIKRVVLPILLVAVVTCDLVDGVSS